MKSTLKRESKDLETVKGKGRTPVHGGAMETCVVVTE